MPLPQRTSAARENARLGADRLPRLEPTMPAGDPYVRALRFRFLTRFYDGLAAATVRERRLRELALELAAPPDGARVLDLGCGTGSFAILLRRQRSDLQVAGVDGDPEILELARRKAAAAGVEVEFREGLAQELPFQDASFDLVTATLVLHHLAPAAKRAALREIRRVLRPGGRVLLADWCASSALRRLLFFPVRVLDGFAATADHAGGRVPALVRAAGFEEVREAGRLPTAFGLIAFLTARRPQ